MEAFALWAIKLVFGLMAVLVVMAAVRALIRVFRASKTFAAGAAIAASLGILYFLFSRSLVSSALISMSMGIALYLIWLGTAFHRDTKVWTQVRLSDTYQAYASYLKLDVKRFRKQRATELARRRLKEQIAFFIFLQHKNKSPSASIPVVLANSIAQAPIGKSAKLLLNISRDVGGMLTAYTEELKLRQRLPQQLSAWKAKLSVLTAQQSDSDAPSSLASEIEKAKEQISAHETLLAQHHELLDPKRELSPILLYSVERQLEAVLSRAFGFLIPPELLQIKLRQQTEPDEEKGAFSMSLKYALTSQGIGRLMEKTTPPTHYSYLRPSCSWSIELDTSNGILRDEFKTSEPNGWTNTAGVKRIYAYLLVRGYADFAWELLRAMGFVTKDRYDTSVSGDHGIDVPATKSMKDLLEEFKKEIENVHESQLTEGISITAVGTWIQQNDSDMRAASKEVEQQLADELSEFFQSSFGKFNNLLHLPDLAIGDS